MESRIAVGFGATGFEFFQECGFTGVLPITAGNEVVIGDGIEVPVVGFDGWLMFQGVHETRKRRSIFGARENARARGTSNIQH